MNRIAPFPALVLVVAGLVSSGTARAAVIYDSSLPFLGVGVVTADVANTSTITSTDFTIGAASQVNEVKWYGEYYPGAVAPASDSFTIRFFDYSGSVPSATPLFTYSVGNAVQRTNSGIKSFNNNAIIYSYDAVIPTSSLAAGRYAFSVQDNTLVAGSNNYFFWETGQSTGHKVFLGSSVLLTDRTTAFSLFGTIGTSAVPEPASLLMLGTGSLILLAAAGRRGFEGRRIAP